MRADWGGGGAGGQWAPTALGTGTPRDSDGTPNGQASLSKGVDWRCIWDSVSELEGPPGPVPSPLNATPPRELRKAAPGSALGRPDRSGRDGKTPAHPCGIELRGHKAIPL